MHTCILKVLLIIHAYFSVAYSERPYKLILKRLEIVEQDEDFAYTNVSTTRINRHTTAYNVNIEVKVDIPYTCKVTVRMYEFLNNEYRPFAVNIVRSYCDFIEMEYKKFIYPDMIRIGADMPEAKCPVLKGKYSIENYTVNAEFFPAGLPFHNGLLEIRLTNFKRILTIAHVYFILDRDVIIRERYS